MIYKNLGNYDQALEFLFNSRKIFEELNDKKNIALSFNNIGLIYTNLNEPDKALKYFKNSAKIKKELGNNKNYASSVNNIGTIYHNLKQFEKTLEYFKKSLKIYDDIGYKNGTANSLNNIALCFKKMSKFDDSIGYFLKSLKLKEEIRDKYGLANTMTNIGNCFAAQSRLDDASFYLQKGLKQAKSINAKILIKNSYESLSDLYIAKNDYQKAYQYYKMFTNIKDSIFNEESTKKIAELQTKYETDKKERETEIYKLKNVELQKKNKQITRQKNLLLKTKKELKDINENLEKRVQEELQKKEQQRQLLIRKSKLESLGKLSAGIAHEINQPLGGISMGLDNIIQKSENKTLSDYYLIKKCNTLFTHIGRIEKIIEHIRVFSRDQQSTIKEQVDINETIVNALSMVRTQYRNHNIEINRQMSKDPLFCQGNKFKLEQVILNLLSNAKDAVEAREYSDPDHRKIISIRSFQNENKNILEIEDNGIGIAEENLLSIFDPFFTSKEAEQGTGLGLSISYGIIREMDGEIIVESNHGEFTRIRIVLQNDEIEVKK